MSQVTDAQALARVHSPCALVTDEVGCGWWELFRWDCSECGGRVGLPQLCGIVVGEEECLTWWARTWETNTVFGIL